MLVKNQNVSPECLQVICLILSQDHTHQLPKSMLTWTKQPSERFQSPTTRGEQAYVCKDFGDDGPIETVKCCCANETPTG